MAGRNAYTIHKKCKLYIGVVSDRCKSNGEVAKNLNKRCRVYEERMVMCERYKYPCERCNLCVLTMCSENHLFVF